ncbi:MAG: 4-vinyl reductase [Patescibacteria group bacterium]
MDESNKTVTRIVGGGHATWKDGEFFVWNIPGMNLPMYTYIEIIELLRKECPKIDQILYAVGEKQSVLAADYMKNKFGIKRAADQINSVLQQTALLGFGELKCVKCNLEEGVALYKNEKSPFAKYLRQMYGLTATAVDAYLSGILAGTLQAVTGKVLVCIETKCIAKGDNYCFFEIKQPKDLRDGEAHYSKLLGPEKIRGLGKEKSMISSANQ